jgi:hypothetical protein
MLEYVLERMFVLLFKFLCIILMPSPMRVGANFNFGMTISFICLSFTGLA